MALLPRPALELGAKAGVSFAGEGLDTLKVYVQVRFSGWTPAIAEAIRPIANRFLYSRPVQPVSALRTGVKGGSSSVLRLPGTWILLLAYLAFNLGAWVGSEPVTTWDSGRYTSGNIFLFLNPGVPPTFLFSTVSNPSVAVFVQVTLYAAAWISLALAVLYSLHRSWIRWPIAALALLASLTSPLWAWNLVIGSEGLTVIAVVLWMSTFVWLARSARSFAWILSTGAASALLVTRPQTILFVVPIHIVVSLWWSRRHRRPWADVKGS